MAFIPIDRRLRRFYVKCVLSVDIRLIFPAKSVAHREKKNE